MIRHLWSMPATLVMAASLMAPVAIAGQWHLGVEAGVYKPERNRVQIPNDAFGDRFDITDLDNDAFPVLRLTLGGQFADRHEMQFVYAPFVYTAKGSFDQSVRFDGAAFDAGDQVEARYQFSNYRLRYLYHWLESDRWRLDVGGTLFVRDASVRLRAGNVESKDSNVGVVPLFAARYTYELTPRWSAMLDTDLAIAPQGRAIDLALLADYRVSDTVQVSAGYRTIEGGADNDEVYSFAWFNGAVIRVNQTW